MERKGLSQILYLIIAASVLMMIAMVITFTATDTIGGLGGSASETACLDSLRGSCNAQATSYVTLPESQCISENQYVGGLASSMVYDSPGGSSAQTASTVSSAGPASTYYVQCTSLP